MNTQKYYLLLALIASILCATALSQVEPPFPEYEPLLLGRAHPELTGISELYVTILRTDLLPQKKIFYWKQPEAKVQEKLKHAGIKIVPDVYVGRRVKKITIPELTVYIDTLKISDSQQQVFCVRTSLSRAVYLKEQSGLICKADVWKMGPSIQLVSAQGILAKISEVILEQVEVFVTAWRLANPKGAQVTDANQADVSQRKPTKYIYVASKKSQVFHKSTCPWAKKIAPKNLLKYRTRNDAITAGKRPCKICKP